MSGGEKMPDLKSEILKVLRYEPETGNFIWLVDQRSYAGKAKAGSSAGTEKDGYLQLKVCGRLYRAHRLAWFLQTGEFPPKGFELDHINRNRADNRWCNLRLVTRTQNNMNAGISKANRSGVRGVSFRKDTGKWHARIKVEKRIVMLGNFSNKDDAAAARKAAELKYCGEYAPA